jgi:hypothetical protein
MKVNENICEILANGRINSPRRLFDWSDHLEINNRDDKVSEQERQIRDLKVIENQQYSGYSKANSKENFHFKR